MDTTHIFSLIEDLNEPYCDLWEKVCNMESPTEYKQGVDAVGQVFIRLAREYQWDVEVLELETAGNPICITMNSLSQAQPLVFSAHIDTVYPLGTFPSPAVYRKDGRMYGSSSSLPAFS